MHETTLHQRAEAFLHAHVQYVNTVGLEEGVSLLSATESHVQAPSEGKWNPRAAQLLPDLLQSAHLLPSCRHCESGGLLGLDPQQQSQCRRVLERAGNANPRAQAAEQSGHHTETGTAHLGKHSQEATELTTRCATAAKTSICIEGKMAKGCNNTLGRCQGLAFTALCPVLSLIQNGLCR